MHIGNWLFVDWLIGKYSHCKVTAKRNCEPIKKWLIRKPINH